MRNLIDKALNRGYVLLPLAAPHHRWDGLVCWKRGKKPWPSPSGGRGNTRMTYEKPRCRSPRQTTCALVRECGNSRVSPFELAVVLVGGRESAGRRRRCRRGDARRRQRVRIGGLPIASPARPWQEPARHRALTCASTGSRPRAGRRRHSTIRRSTASFQAQSRPLCCAHNISNSDTTGDETGPSTRRFVFPHGDTNPNAGRCTM